MANQSKDKPQPEPKPEQEPRNCWHCDCPYSSTQEFCYKCQGWTLPTKTKTKYGEGIDWKKFVILASDPEAKAKQMKDAALAINANENVAILGVQSVKDYRGKIDEKAVFILGTGGAKRLSHSKPESPPHANSRKWPDIKASDWEAFEQIVGEVTMTVKYPVPDYFPKPGHLSFKEE